MIDAFIAVLVFAGAIANPGYAQDAEHGKTIFKACAVCHATDHANRAGPGLEGIVGRKAGTAPGFSYSSAMKKSDIVWDTKILDAYLESPQQVVSRKQDALRRAEERDGPDGPRYLSCYAEVTAH
jgi:cytochrome c